MWNEDDIRTNGKKSHLAIPTSCYDVREVAEHMRSFFGRCMSVIKIGSFTRKLVIFHC